MSRFFFLSSLINSWLNWWFKISVVWIPIGSPKMKGILLLGGTMIKSQTIKFNQWSVETVLPQTSLSFPKLPLYGILRGLPQLPGSNKKFPVSWRLGLDESVPPYLRAEARGPRFNQTIFSATKEKGPWLFRGYFLGMEVPTQLYRDYNKPWHKDPY